MNKKILILLFLGITTAEAQTSAVAIADSLYAVGNYTEAIKQLKKSEENSEAVWLRMAKSFEAKN